MCLLLIKLWDRSYIIVLLCLWHNPSALLHSSAIELEAFVFRFVFFPVLFGVNIAKLSMSLNSVYLTHFVSLFSFSGPSPADMVGFLERSDLCNTFFPRFIYLFMVIYFYSPQSVMLSTPCLTTPLISWVLWRRYWGSSVALYYVGLWKTIFLQKNRNTVLCKSRATPSFFLFSWQNVEKGSHLFKHAKHRNTVDEAKTESGQIQRDWKCLYSST